MDVLNPDVIQPRKIPPEIIDRGEVNRQVLVNAMPMIVVLAAAWMVFWVTERPQDYG